MESIKLIPDYNVQGAAVMSSKFNKNTPDDCPSCKLKEDCE